MRLRFARLFSVAAFVALAGISRTGALAAEVPIPPAPAEWATDTAGFLKPETIGSLNTRLKAYQKATGHQILVYVAPTTGATPLEDWTVRAATKWKAGRKGLDDGLMLFVFSQDHKLRIEVGYGLESAMPDATAAEIIRNTITPGLKAGDPDAAITAGVGRILATVGGEPGGTTPPPEPVSQAQESGDSVLVYIFLILVFGLLIGVWTLRLFGFSHVYIGSGAGFARSGSFGGGGGGFSGGGGSFGGGGSSGSW